jgi:hypothetical protein
MESTHGINTRSDSAEGAARSARSEGDAFAAASKQPETGATGMTSLPQDVVQGRIMPLLSQEELDSLSKASKPARAAVKQYQAHTTIADLASTGIRSPADPRFAVSHIRLHTHFEGLDEEQRRSLIGDTLSIRDDNASATAIGTAAKNWTSYSESEKDDLLDGAIGIWNAKDGAIALAAIGQNNLHNLSAGQQRRWAGAVSDLPGPQRCFVVQQTNVKQLGDEPHTILRRSVLSLPPGFDRKQSLGRLGPGRYQAPTT